ncbi:MAG TPA: CPBP family intramembrane glutamic endopeptidase, partial [Actinoplanes sp.]|nr:CPBP family intramembrane glutamic endopeptidase [Actinoplanes sp.]
LPYHLVLRGGWPGKWRPAVGILLGALAFVLMQFVALVPFVAYWAATGRDIGSSLADLADLDNVTPVSLAYLNLALAGLIPTTWIIVRYLHGLRPRWLSSVFPRLRWGYLFVCVGLSFVALIATVAVGALLPQEAASSVAGDLNEFTPTVRDFLLVVLFLTPLQAAAEEYAFRGYLLQAFGGLVRSPYVAVGLTSLLFALAHGAQDAPIFFDRFAFGLVAGILVVVTGGLEAPIAMHVLNNWLAFGIALAFGDMGSALNPSGGTWWSIPVTLTQSVTYLLLAWWVARAMGLTTRTDPAVLAAPETRV